MQVELLKLLTWCETFDMVQSYSLAVFLGSVRARSSVCLHISGQFRACIQNFFITLRVTAFFFRNIDLLCSLR